MFVYLAAPLPNIDYVCKVGLTGSPTDRLSTFNCSSGRRFGGVFWKVYSDPEHWEGELLRHFTKFRIARSYGLSELIDVRSALNDVCGIYVSNCRDPVSMAWLAQSISAMGMLSCMSVADGYFGDLICYAEERVSENPVFRRCIKELNARRSVLWPSEYRLPSTNERCRKPLRQY